MSVYVIAEIGPNHNGDLAVAREIIGRLAATGVDAVKFQLAVPENVYSRDAFKAAYQVVSDGDSAVIEMSRRVQLKAADHKVLYEDCRRLGIDYMCTAFDLESLAFLDAHFELPYFKMASGEILTRDMLEFMAARKLPILLSTGMANLDEIGDAIAVLESQGPADITVLHCVSNYPAPTADINLRAMDLLTATFGRPVGYSDHSLGPLCCIAAVAKGAVVIEKHVTLDRAMPGPDHKASATVAEMAELVAAIRDIEAALGVADKVFSEAEREVRRMARKSLVTTRDMRAGETISADDLCAKRPGTGISPMRLATLVGATLKRDIAADHVVFPADIGD